MAIIKFSSAKISANIGIEYICNKEKTLGKLISGKDCMPESCYEEFQMVKHNFNKMDGRTYYHMMPGIILKERWTLLTVQRYIVIKS